MNKKIYVIATLVLALFVSLQGYSQNVSAKFDASDFAGGEGTEASPYLISNVDELARLDAWANAEKTAGVFFKLANDITETPFKGMIATSGVFEGVFDGDNHCVRVEADFADGNYVGFIGFMVGATVKNLQISGNVNGGMYVGGVIGQAANGCTIENVINYASVNAKMFAGGIIGQLITQEDCTPCSARHIANYGTISSKYCGGVIGDMGQQVGNTIECIANYGHINGDKKSGGLIANARPYDYVYYGFNFGTTENDTPQGCLGNTKSSTVGELYYDSQIFNTVNENKMQSGTTIDFIGENFMSVDNNNGFHFDKWLYEDNMYPRPIMNGMEKLTIPVLYATPLLLASGNTLNNITEPFKVVTLNGVVWSSKNGNITFNGSDAAPAKTGDDVITATLNGVSRDIKVHVDASAGIDDINASDIDVKAAYGSIIINLSDNAAVKIFDMSGSFIKSCKLEAGVHTFEVPEGLFIVRINGSSYKVCVNK